MGDVRFVRAVAEGRDVVFAYTPGGRPAWAYDRITGRQWWYDGGDLRLVREAITEHWYDFDRMPVAPASPPDAREAVPARGPDGDLRLVGPGQALLARIADLHAQASGDEVLVLPDDIVGWSVGFVGEEAVATTLASLGAGWHVLHGVPLGAGGEVADHVVIGPAGVVALVTAVRDGARVDVRRDAVFVAGRYEPLVETLRFAGRRTTEAVRRCGVDSPARALLVTVGARLSVHDPARDVTAVRLDELVAWLRARPQVLDERDVDALHRRLSVAGTWGAAPPIEPVADWVAELARGLAAEHRLLTDTRRRSPGAAPAYPSVPAPQTRAARLRRRTSGAPPVRGLVWRVAAIAAFVATVLLFLPIAFALAWTTWTAATSPRPAPRPTISSAPTVGGACVATGTTAADGSGTPLICQTTSTGTAVWVLRG